MSEDTTGKYTGTTPPKVVHGPLPKVLPDLIPRKIPVEQASWMRKWWCFLLYGSDDAKHQDCLKEK